MATGATLLALMKLVNNELEPLVGQIDHTRALTALNASQDALEAVLSQHAVSFGSAFGNVTTAANTETTAWPVVNSQRVLRIDGMQHIDPATGRPTSDLEPLYGAGSHVGPTSEVFFGLPVPTAAKPRYWWGDGTLLYWHPIPDAVYTIRWYGLSAQADITNVSTFAFPDHLMLPLATLGVQFMRTALDDDNADISGLANALFAPSIAQMSRFQRQRPAGFSYKYFHTT